jgi:hypothetical protein
LTAILSPRSVDWVVEVAHSFPGTAWPQAPRGGAFFVAALACLLGSACGGFHPVAVDGGPPPADADLVLEQVPDVDVGLPDGAVLRAVWGSSSSDVHMVGDDGLVRDWTGKEWQAPMIGAGKDLTGVWGTGPDNIYAVGMVRDTSMGYVLYRGPDHTWVILSSKIMPLRAMWGNDTLRVACGRAGVVYQGPPADPFITGMQFPPQAGVTTDFAPILYSVGGNSPSSVMIAGDVQSTYYYDGSWHQYIDPTNPTRAFRAIFALPQVTPSIWEGANYYGLFHFTSSKDPVAQLNDEEDVPQNISRSIWGIWGPSDDQIVAVGDGGRIMTYDSQSRNIRIRESPTGQNLYGIWGSSLDDVYIVGAGGTLLHGRVRF